ncbi:hypothetical protein D3C71_1829590 [compost metagenome]
MNTSPMAIPSAKAAAANVVNAVDVSVSDDQRAVLERIAAQRERIAARRSARAQTLALRSRQATTMPTTGPMAERLVAFARLHPMAVAAAAGLALALGPRRVIRWAGVALPMIARFRR